MRRLTVFTIGIVLLAQGLAAAAKNGKPDPSEMRTIEDVVYAKVGDRELHMDLALPKEQPSKPLPAIVWIHGGGWQSGSHKQNKAAKFVGSGYVAASVEYRLTGEAAFPAQIQDCKAAIRYLRANAKTYGIDPDHIGVWGGSAGGHLVALMGTTNDLKALEGNYGSVGVSSRVQAVCDFFGPTDLTSPASVNLREPGPVAKFLGGPREQKMEVARMASPMHHITKDAAPTLIVHGDKDPLIPMAQSEMFYDALRRIGVPTAFIKVKNAGHGFGGGNKTDQYPSADKIDQKVLQFFDKYLKAF